jgi:hypothetical protein
MTPIAKVSDPCWLATHGVSLPSQRLPPTDGRGGFHGFIIGCCTEVALPFLGARESVDSEYLLARANNDVPFLLGYQTR